MQTPVNQPLLFLKKFLKHGITIASITPSTKFLSQRTVAGIDWNQARLVVELGAGTGPITQEIVNRARPECTVIVIEQPKEISHGDYATNVALVLSKKVGKNPMEIAQKIAGNIKNKMFEKMIMQNH